MPLLLVPGLSVPQGFRIAVIAGLVGAKSNLVIWKKQLRWYTAGLADSSLNKSP